MIKNFKDCLKAGKIKKFSRGKTLSPKEIKLAEEDLKIAEKSFKDKVVEVIETIRPMLQSDGGDIELVGVDEDNSVRVRLQGACKGCPGAQMTLKNGGERLLLEKVPEVKAVIAVD